MKPVIIIYQEETKELKNATRVTKKKKKFNNEGNARAPGIAPVKRTKTQHKSRCEKNNEKKIPQREKREKKKRHEARMDGQVVLEALAK